MALFRRTIDSGITPSESPTSTTTRSCAEAALNDQTAMFLGGNWQISTMKSMVDEEVWSNWKVARSHSRAPTSLRRALAAGRRPCSPTTRKSVRPPSIYSQFTTAENMALRCREGGFLPTRQTVFEDNEFFRGRVFPGLLEPPENGQARPGYPIYTTISSEWRVAAGKVITDRHRRRTPLRR